MTISPKKLYLVVASAEMVTWTGLIIAMIARYGFGYDGGLFFVAGLSHGIVFIVYWVTSVTIGINLRWGVGTILVALLAAIPPWLTIPVDRWLLKKGKLESPWRLEESSSGDFGFLDRLVRWWISRPWLYLVAMVATMTLVISVLLMLGSPTEWGSN